MNRRRRRSLALGVAAAGSTSAAGVAVNVATQYQDNVAAWLAVGAITLLVGAVTAAVDHARTGPPLLLMIDHDVHADGSTSSRIRVHDPEVARALVERMATFPQQPMIPPGVNGRFPKPVPISLITRRRAVGIARCLEQVGDCYGGSADLHVRVCIDDDPQRRHRELLAGCVVLLDDLYDMSGADPGMLGGLDLAGIRGADGAGISAAVIVLGCNHGAGFALTEALSRSLDSPTAFLGCREIAPLDHRRILYPAVLDALGELGGAEATPQVLQGALDSALARVRRERTRMDWGRWTTAVLDPA